MKNPHAVSLGRLGGRAGKGSSKARSAFDARKAATARWDKYRARMARIAPARPTTQGNP